MMSKNHHSRRFLATAFVAATAILGPAAPDAGGTPPSPDRAFEAYRAISDRVRTWSSQVIPSPRIDEGVSITLRYQGEVVGRGTVMQPEGEADELDCLDLALRKAMEQAEARLPVPADATRARALASLAPDIAISIEIAGELQPFAPEALGDATLLISPGLEGLAVRAGDRTLATFPSHMLADSLPPGRALASLVSSISGDPASGLRPPSELRDALGLEFYRFGVIHLAQIDPSSQPVFLTRGGRQVPQSGLNTAGLKTWRDDLIQHLLAQRLDAPGGATIRGTLDPVSGLSEAASPLQRALVCLALSSAGSTPLDQPMSPAMRLAADLLHAFADEAAASPSILDDPATAAAWLLVSTGDVTWRADRARAEALASACRARARAVGQAPDQVPPALLALVACALAGDGASGHGGEGSLSIARDLMVRLLRDTPPGQVVSLMPWLGGAQLMIALADDSAEVPGVVTLRQTRALLWANQLDEADTGPEAIDLLGGIVFTQGSVPLPSWHAIRPLACAALMLGDRRITPDSEVATELPRLLASLRFFRQLTADESVAHMYRSRELALGGVRSALWDQRMPPEATAMTLLTVQFTLESLDAIGARRAAPRTPASETPPVSPSK